MIRKSKASKKSTLRNKCDTLFSRQTREEGVCLMSGLDYGNCGGGLQTCHIKSRRYLCLRYDPQNVVCLCAAHHRYTHNNPDVFIRWIEKTFPGRIDYLNEVMRSGVKKDYAEIERNLKGIKPFKPSSNSLGIEIDPL